MNFANQLLAKMANLNIDRASGAPHKPLFLLVILDIAERGELPERLPLTPELAFQFYTYWQIVAHRRKQRPDVRFPFFHMRSDGFWRPLDENGDEATERGRARAAALTPEFFAFVNDPALREQTRRILIAKYFQLPQERIALYTLAEIPIPSEDEIEADANYQAKEEAKVEGRTARFRLNVVATYNYTCALTGYRLTTISAGSIVEAAHIHAFSSSQNNDVRNGLALCQNSHWMFDNGIWTLSDEYKVMLFPERFAESSPNQKPLADYEGKQIFLPVDRNLWPDLRYIAWHRDYWTRAD
jgi:putative restriction endonuclease